MSSKKSKSGKNPVDSTRLLTDSKYNYLSSDNGTNTSTSVAGVGCPQSSDDNLSEHNNRNKNQLQRAPDNSMYRTHNNPHLISHKFSNTNQHNRYYRRKKHTKSKNKTEPHLLPNMHYPPYPYPYPPNATNPTSQPYYAYPYPPPAPYPPYPYPYPTVPAHGDVAITQSFTPPPAYHQNKRGKEQTQNQSQIHQIPPYYYYPSPYYPHGPPPTHNQHNNNNNMPYPYNMNPYGHVPYAPGIGMPTGKTSKKKNIDIDTDMQPYDDDTKVANAEPMDDDVNSRNKLFGDLDGYENDEAQNKTVDLELFDTYNSSFISQKHRYNNISKSSREASPGDCDEDNTNCIKLCILLCDMENVFEAIEIIILLVFISFIAVWWVDRENKNLLLTLGGSASIFGMLVINMRRAQSSLRLHELGSTLNDFRFILFTIGLCVVIAADQMRYAANEDDVNIRYLWMAHSFVWIIAGMLWCTIDFAAYMSYFVSTCYHIFIFIGTALEFAKVCYQIWDPTDIPRTLYEHNDIEYTLYDFKIDGLLLMLLVELSTIITLMRDRKREWYCFGLSHVFRHRLLQISQRQERMVHERMIHRMNRSNHDYNNGRHGRHGGSIGSSHLVHNVSGNRYFYMFGSNEDSLLLIWIINLGVVTYLTFFIWDAHSAYKSIPAAIAVLAFIILVYRECDFHLIPLMKQQTHVWFLLMAVMELWFVIIYTSIYVDRSNKNEMWKQIGSFFVDITMLSIGMILIFSTDLLISSVSSYFIIRGTMPVMMSCVSLFSAWYLSFDNYAINKIQWPLAIIVRNGYYILITMCLVSIIKWIRDPVHKYFIFILNRRKRTILYEHRYRDQHSNKLLFNEKLTRDHSITAHGNQIKMNAHSGRSLMGPAFINNRNYHERDDEQYHKHNVYDNRMQRVARNKAQQD